MKGPKTNDRCFPLPRRTGHADFPHPALARVVYSRTRSQRNQPQVVQVGGEANARSGPPATLAAPSQVFAQAALHELIEVAECLRRVLQAQRFDRVAPATSR